MERFTIDADGLHFGDETLAFAQVERLVIRTTSDGPWAEDAFWCFVAGDAMFEVPNGAMQEGRIDTLQAHLPGMDPLAIVQAMGSTTEAVFPVYDRLVSRLDPKSLQERFSKLVEALGGRVPDGRWESLLAAWREPHRRHHGLRHLAECLDVLDRLGAGSGDGRTVELALWFHDAVYDPTRTDNEERSAAWLSEFGSAARIPQAIVARAAGLVRSTAHPTDAIDAGADADLMHDVDFSILGAEPFRFFEYERAIRQEYAHVGALGYALARGSFIDGLLASPRIFRTPAFAAEFESRARAQLAYLLSMRAYTPYRWVRAWRRAWRFVRRAA